MINDMRESKRKWNEDSININKYNEKGIAELGRAYDDLPQKEKFDHSITQLPIVARGITAFLADWGKVSYREREHGFNQGIGLKVFFNSYYTHCFKFLRNIDRNRTSYEFEWKSEMQLAVEHLENEIKILSEPQLFYSEFINNESIEKERSVADDIKKAALYYLEWVKETQIKEENKEHQQFKTLIQTPEQLISSTQPRGSKTEITDIGIKPIFKPVSVQNIFESLQDFFIEEHQIKLLQIIQSGNDSTEQLIFLGNGNRLADAFKQLFENDIITGCEKKELERWICSNFQYRHRQQIKTYTADYIEKCISRNDQPCKNPIFEIKNGQIKKMNSY